MSTARSKRNAVRRRAGDRCEYCRMAQSNEPFLPYHVEHIIAKQHGGGDELINLCFACYHCNYHKGTNLTAIDPETDAVVRLFNPRTDDWDKQFSFGPTINGRTPIGRATVRLLCMNEISRIEQRCLPH